MTPDPQAPRESNAAGVNRSRPPVPRAIGNACRLIIGSLMLGIVSLLPGIRVPRPDDPEIPLAFTLGSIVVFGGLTLWLALEVWRGKNWARWAMLAYLVLGWWLGAGEMGDDFLRSPLLGTLDAACVTIEAVACALLFFGAGGRWFSALDALRRNARKGR
jgi:hypothetical protein